MIQEIKTKLTGRPEAEAKKKGFTLTEIAIVLGIIGIILGSIWVAAAAVYNNLRVSHANTEFLQLVQGIRGLYATQTSTAGLNNQQVICSNAEPSDMAYLNCAGAGAATGLNSPWPGTATVVVAPSTDAANAGFTVSMTNVPPPACISLLTALGGTNRDPGLFAAEGGAAFAAGVGGTASTAAGVANNAPITPAIAQVACGTGTAPGLVLFGFNLKS